MATKTEGSIDFAGDYDLPHVFIHTTLKEEGKRTVIDIKNLMEDIRIFSVQIAASRDESWLLFSENFVNFRVHEVGELNAYSIGSFATEDEANFFRDKIIEMGIKDAWVVAYEDGDRLILHK